MQEFIELLFKNPIFKIIGVMAVLYFGLYANKKDPDSLGNRLSKENIKKNVSEVKEKSFFIIDNIRKAEELQKEKLSTQQDNQKPQK